MKVVTKADDQTIPVRAFEKAASEWHNRDFTQVYPKGWLRIRYLLKENPPLARLYVFLAQHIDSTCGAVVASIQVMADELQVSTRTIKRHLKELEQHGALVRIRLAGSVYAYALDPEEVWKSWEAGKDMAAFRTKTLVKKSDRANALVRRRLMVMLGEQPELPFRSTDAS